METDLEKNILEHLKEFLLELGKGFMFVGSQVRLTLEEDHFYPDLVFYNRLLKCFVIIDLKIGKVTHQDIGQMQMYVNYYDREIKSTDENPSNEFYKHLGGKYIKQRTLKNCNFLKIYIILIKFNLVSCV